MDWQLPDIAKRITNNLLPSNLSANTLQSFCQSAETGYFPAFPYRVIPIDTHW